MKEDYDQELTYIIETAGLNDYSKLMIKKVYEKHKTKMKSQIIMIYCMKRNSNLSVCHFTQKLNNELISPRLIKKRGLVI
jgi:predicted YcjX-like family ATPase